MSDEKTFEQAMEELKQVVEKLESGNLSLDESLSTYNEGMELSKYCQQKLADAKASVVTIMQENGEEKSFKEDE